MFFITRIHFTSVTYCNSKYHLTEQYRIITAKETRTIYWMQRRNHNLSQRRFKEIVLGTKDLQKKIIVLWRISSPWQKSYWRNLKRHLLVEMTQFLSKCERNSESIYEFYSSFRNFQRIEKVCVYITCGLFDDLYILLYGKRKFCRMSILSINL